jgi:hypothetical protein
VRTRVSLRHEINWWAGWRNDQVRSGSLINQRFFVLSRLFVVENRKSFLQEHPLSKTTSMFLVLQQELTVFRTDCGLLAQKH